MGRNCKSRYVQAAPAVKGFRPFGRLGGQRRTVVLSLDEYEAIRLMDYEHLTQEEAAVRMQISRPTLTRIYEKARVNYATALVEGSILLIDGGEVHFMGKMFRCGKCRRQVESSEENQEECPSCGPQENSVPVPENEKQCNGRKRFNKGDRYART